MLPRTILAVMGLTRQCCKIRVPEKLIKESEHRPFCFPGRAGSHEKNNYNVEKKINEQHRHNFLLNFMLCNSN